MGYGPAGRDTLAAIAEDVAAIARGDAPRQGSSPDVSFELAPAGRETLAAIVGEAAALGGPGGARAHMTTLSYEERPGGRKEEAGPEIDVREATAGRETLAAIESEAGARAPGRARTVTRGYAEAPAAPAAVGRDTLNAIARAMTNERAPESATRAALEAFEMATFVVRGDDLTTLSSEAARRAFVKDRLLHRLPVPSMDDVDRIDVTPWTVKNTVIVRVWCRVEAP